MAKYNEDLVKEICKHISNGVLNKDAATLSGIGESTFYEWINDKPEFAEAVKKAEAERKRRFIATIAAASIESWQAAAWYLERVYHNEFGRKDKMEHEGKIEHKLSYEEAIELIDESNKRDSVKKLDPGKE